MGTTDIESTIVSVPSDDGSIGRAIEELDAGISSWVEAIRSAQRTIEQAASANAAAESALAEAAAGVHAAAQVVANEISSTDAIADVPATSARAEAPVEQALAPEKTETAKAPAKKGLRLGHLKETTPAPVPVKKGIRVYEESVAEPPQKDAHELSEEDEALLAELNPKVARQVRIRRRLCNGSKSIRELIAEVKG